jgi:hypothetical protein
MAGRKQTVKFFYLKKMRFFAAGYEVSENSKDVSEKRDWILKQ